ncbi:hypothetical protein CPB86DRAFT_731353 [Serendipita vermifera]|nr:hypothetical protein CPB86DRAFT_731353 [Serendipita vermifera]
MDEADIYKEALSLFDEQYEEDADIVKYGNLALSVAPKEGKACSLLADQLFSPSLALAELLELGRLDCKNKTWLELGAGTGLVSLVAATNKNPPSLVILTDYPDPLILDNLKLNVETNRKRFMDTCSVKVDGYEWGNPADHLKVGPTENGFDLIIMSDLLYFDKSHPTLLQSLTLLLARTEEARVYVAAGKYTPAHVCQNFLENGEMVGLVWEEQVVNGEWKGTTDAGTYTRQQLADRKNNTSLWIGRWSASVLYMSTAES